MSVRLKTQKLCLMQRVKRGKKGVKAKFLYFILRENKIKERQKKLK